MPKALKNLIKKSLFQSQPSKIIRVLLIDGNSGYSEVIRIMLDKVTGTCFDLIGSKTLSDDRHPFDKNAVDVILLDLESPDSQGIELFDKVNAQAQGVPIIVLTAIDNDEVALEAVQKGAQDHFVKAQVDGKMLARAIRYAIERKRIEEGLKKQQEHFVEKSLHESYERLREAFIEMVNTLALTIEMRDPYTAGHQRRVTILACAIAEEMGLSDDQFDGLRMAGLIHDLGKINVPAEILSKPGRLNQVELNIIRYHPQICHDLLRVIDLPWPVAKIVLHHHERMDASGYPQGLKGSEIMLEARILAVADVIEAMASHRPYRPSLGIELALEEIKKNRGTLYDSEVVDACVKLFSEKNFWFD